MLLTGDNGADKPIVSMLNGREVAGAKRLSTDAAHYKGRRLEGH